MFELSEYEKRLHKIILYSADVLPTQVEAYLEELLNSPNRNEKITRDILTNILVFRPLIDSIPKAFASFAIEALVKGEDQRQHTSEDSNAEEALPDDICKELDRLGSLKTGRIPQRRTVPKIKTGFQGETYRDPLDFRIDDHFLFLPPSPAQGPFLYLLLTHENEGLRLVHSITNFATDSWVENQKAGSYTQMGLTPLPVTIHFPFGIQKFWGDTQIYCWFRGTTTGPYSVISALMALEEWMERQIESGRDVENLFQIVLESSHSVAVLGICISIALAYPGKCLKMVFPIVSCPYVWGMDIERHIHDSTNSSWSIFSALSNRDKMHYSIIERRNKRPQRLLEVRTLAMHYMLSNDESLKVPFENVVAQFTKNLPFQYQEQIGDSVVTAELVDKMQNYQVFGQKENYRARRTDDRWEFWVERPQAIKERNEEFFRSYFNNDRGLGVWLWANKTIEGKSCDERMTLDGAVSAAKELQTAEDFKDLDIGNFYDNTRIQAIVGVATAILVVDFEWTKANNHLEWSRAILLAAAHITPSPIHEASKTSIKVYAGHGLSLLVAHGTANHEVRIQVLELLGQSLTGRSSNDEVAKAIFEGLINAWVVDSVLCWNALNLCLSLALIPNNIFYGRQVGEFGISYDERENFERKVIKDHLYYLSKNKITKLSRVPRDRDIAGGLTKLCETLSNGKFPSLRSKLFKRQGIKFVPGRAQVALFSLPCSKLLQDSYRKKQIIQLCDDLVLRTIEENLPTDEDNYPPRKDHRWNSFLFEWVAYLAKSLSLDEIQQHIFRPLQEHWPHTLELIAHLLDGYITHQIAYVEGPTTQALESWNILCTWVLSHPSIIERASRDALGHNTEEILGLILFVQYGSTRIKKTWTHAHLFTDTFEQWVDTVGHCPSVYGYLLTMLNGVGWQFAPETTLRWLNACTNKAAHSLWSEKYTHSERTTELLNHIWINFEQQIRNNTESLRQYSQIVYQLVRIGVPLASILQTKLEARQ